MSKGMLQRLGLAQALLGDPELLVLDEPMSGLDPHGRKLVRDLILEQRAHGRTVLFSTHILSDVEIVCTRAGMLQDGVVAKELRLDELSGLAARAVEVQVVGLDAGTRASLARLASQVVEQGATTLFVVPPGQPAQDVVRAALAAGASIEGVVPRRPSLEDVLVTGDAAVAPAARAGTALDTTGEHEAVATRQPAGMVEVH
jgi:ABC-2 type transport system ATP-binding protein